MPRTPAEALRTLERLRTTYGGDVAQERLDALERLDRGRFAEPEEVERLHECLCFLRAYPDDDRVLARVERMLATFHDRADLKRNRRYLEQTGIAGTLLQFPFYWETARWMARRYPDHLVIDWKWWDPGKQARLLDQVLPLLVPYSETPALDSVDLSPREWIERLKGPDETDATFLIRRFERLAGDAFSRESLYDSLDVPLICRPAEDGPSRTRARHARPGATYRRTPISSERPDLRRAIEERPRAVRRVSRSEAARLIDVTREAMVTRLRDLYSFSYPALDDVVRIDFGDGLELACFGTHPERRLMLEAVYGLLTLVNGVPAGYVLISSLFRSSEIAYNVFETFRGGEAGRVFGRVLAVAHRLFGARTFSIDPYQLGHGNEEGLASGAWWFYAKMGFRPDDEGNRRLWRRERDRMAAEPDHRSTLATLRRLSSTHLFYRPFSRRDLALGALSTGNVGLRVSEHLAARAGADREDGLDACEAEARRLLGVRSTRRWTRAQRMWWRRWSPLVTILPGIERWPADDRRRLARVVLAKGGASEREFVRLFDGHARLRRAILRLAADR